MQKAKPLIPIIAAVLAGILLVSWRYFEARTLSPQPAKPDDPFVSTGGPSLGDIPPIDAPKFEKPAAADQYLKDTGEGIDLAMNGQHRFYPFQILVWHEIVNDTFGGVPIVVAYDPLTATAAAYKRTVNAADATFTTSGKLWNDDVLMQDVASGSLWAAGTGAVIQGPLAGSKLLPIATDVMAWQDWKKAYPASDVLTRDTGAERDYTRDPYQDYRGTAAVWYPVSRVDAREPSKTLVVGIAADGQATAYPADAVERQFLIEDSVGSLPVLLTYDPNLSVIRAFDRRVNGETLPFALDDVQGIVDKSGSAWSYDGRATRGPKKGTALTQIPLLPSYWFFWAAAYPDTKLYGQKN
jgi:hypothetical protein